MGYTLARSVVGKSPHFHTAYGEGFPYAEPGCDLGPPPSGYPHQIDSRRVSGRKDIIRERSRSGGGLETSITSLHSSGHDSGIVDGGLHCPCGQSTSHSSEESSK